MGSRLVGWIETSRDLGPPEEMKRCNIQSLATQIQLIILNGEKGILRCGQKRALEFIIKESSKEIKMDCLAKGKKLIYRGN